MRRPPKQDQKTTTRDSRTTDSRDRIPPRNSTAPERDFRDSLPRVDSNRLRDIPNNQAGPDLRNTRRYEQEANRNRERWEQDRQNRPGITIWNRSQEGRNFGRPKFYQHYHHEFIPGRTYYSPYSYLGLSFLSGREYLRIVVVQEVVVIKRVYQEVYYLDAPVDIIKISRTIETAFTQNRINLLTNFLAAEIDIYRENRYDYSLRANDYLSITSDALDSYQEFKILGMERCGVTYKIRARHNNKFIEFIIVDYKIKELRI